jgi:ABC-2 type transport system ATP-binding protein
MTISPALAQFALEIRDLAKAFDRPAVDGLQLCVRIGEFYVLLAPTAPARRRR